MLFDARGDRQKTASLKMLLNTECDVTEAGRCRIFERMTLDDALKTSMPR